jgi:lipopolysaccharide/colanic/teichoic acid biosynthesis glycosyltransferase
MSRFRARALTGGGSRYRTASRVKKVHMLALGRRDPEVGRDDAELVKSQGEVAALEVLAIPLEHFERSGGIDGRTTGKVSDAAGLREAPMGPNATLQHEPLVRSLAEAEAIMSISRPKWIFLSPQVDDASVAQILKIAHRTGTDVRVPLELSLVTRPYFGGVRRPPGSLTDRQMESISYPALKRAIDLALGSALFLLTTPLWALLAVAISLTSPGPVLFRQARVMRNGSVFLILKFRTMVANADELLLSMQEDSSQPYFDLRERDSRITPLGRFLRRWSLDELPQLWNVLRGEMSLIGPRPLPVNQVLASPNMLSSRHSVAPGLTGWWQIHGRSDLDATQSLAMDEFYVRNRSLRLDLVILLRTLRVVVSGRGAY